MNLRGMIKQVSLVNIVLIISGFKSRHLAGYYFIFHFAAIFAFLVLRQCFGFFFTSPEINSFLRYISTCYEGWNNCSNTEKKTNTERSIMRLYRSDHCGSGRWLKVVFPSFDFFNSMLITPQPSWACSSSGAVFPMDSRISVFHPGWWLQDSLGLLDLEWIPRYAQELSCLYICDFFCHLWAGYPTSSLAVCRCLITLIFWLFRRSLRVLAVLWFLFASGILRYL